jgi:hypothetical protein
VALSSVIYPIIIGADIPYPSAMKAYGVMQPGPRVVGGEAARARPQIERLG